MFKRMLLLAAGGFTGGLMLSLWVGPAFVDWWNRPLGGYVPSAFVGCPPVLPALRALVWVELAVGICGAVVVTAIGIAVVRRRAKGAPATKPAR